MIGVIVVDKIDQLLVRLTNKGIDSQDPMLLPIKESFTETEKSFFEKVKSLLNKASKEKFIILLVGRTGVGKSSTINALIGQDVAKVSKFTRGTEDAQCYEAEVSGINYIVVDTPGLADSSGNEQQYINSIKSEVSEFHCMWFVTILGESRVRDDEASTIKTISLAFGEEAWKRAIIVFTHADKVTFDEYQESLNERTNLIREEISKHVSYDIAKEIPSVAVVNDPKTGRSKPTPDREPWLGKLYTAVFQKISKEGMLPFFLATANRLQDSNNSSPSFRGYRSERFQPNQGSTVAPEPIKLNPGEKGGVVDRLTKHFDFKDAVAFTALGAAIGTAAGPVGTVVGGVIGAGIATLAWFFKG